MYNEKIWQFEGLEDRLKETETHLNALNDTIEKLKPMYEKVAESASGVHQKADLYKKVLMLEEPISILI